MTEAIEKLTCSDFTVITQTKVEYKQRRQKISKKILLIIFFINKNQSLEIYAGYGNCRFCRKDKSQDLQADLKKSEKYQAIYEAIEILRNSSMQNHIHIDFT